MKTFSVVINGMIEGISHRFHGGSGEAEIYQTDKPGEVGILRDCPHATEEIPKAELEPEDKLEEDEAQNTYPCFVSPEAEESATLREKLLKIPMKDLKSKVAGRGIVKIAMNHVSLVDAILEHPEVAREITGV